MAEAIRVCIIGLGSMGMGTAKACIAAGLTAYGIDLRPSACAELETAGGKAAGDGRAFAGELDAVIVLVINAKQAEEALFGASGIAPLLAKGTPVMMSSTISPDAARHLAGRLDEYGLPMLDAPVSGGPVKAGEGRLTVMAAGPEATFDKLSPVLAAVAENVYRVGSGIGQGAMVKIVHQLLAGVHIAAGAEAMAFAARAGIPLDVMYDVVTHSAGNSWMFENRMKHVVDGDFTARSSVDIFVKDLGLVTETANKLAFPLPLASIAYTMFANASNAGWGNLDDSAVVKIFNGIQLPGEADDV
ncbi:L-threonate dehydrogenase [Chelatococcus sp. GCM10030263]|uniref:L-threonate dehydrogenase n=1 Tax=Chelatococcus sp. GCM10030263 TaxID=3273387 RepID=UPI0036175048